MIDCSTFTDIAITQYWLRVWKTHCWINIVELNRTAYNTLVVIINYRLCADRSVKKELTKQCSTFLRMIKFFKKLLISVVSSHERVWHWAVSLSVLEEKILKLSCHCCWLCAFSINICFWSVEICCCFWSISVCSVWDVDKWLYTDLSRDDDNKDELSCFIWMRNDWKWFMRKKDCTETVWIMSESDFVSFVHSTWWTQSWCFSTVWQWMLRVILSSLHADRVHW